VLVTPLALEAPALAGSDVQVGRGSVAGSSIARAASAPGAAGPAERCRPGKRAAAAADGRHPAVTATRTRSYLKLEVGGTVQVGRPMVRWTGTACQWSAVWRPGSASTSASSVAS
jgi:hypothetical protein